MTDDELDETTPPRPRGNWKRGLFRLALVVGVLAVVWLVTRSQIRNAGERRLADATRDIERSDPQWRVAEIEAARRWRELPTDRNSAVVIDAVKTLIPESWEKGRNQQLDWLFADEMNQPERVWSHLPSPERVERIRSHGEPTVGARDLALTLRDHPTGHRPFVPPDNPMALSLPHLDLVMKVACLLQHDAALAVLEGDPDRGIRAAHAVLNVSRSIGDEPTVLSQAFRMNCRNRAVHTAFQTLAWGTPKDGLEELQAAFLADADESLFLVGVRGERALGHEFFTAVETGRIDGSARQPICPQLPFGPGTFAAYRPLLPADHAEFLRVMTGYVDAARRPWREQRDAVRAVLPDGPSTYFGHAITRVLLPHSENFAVGALCSRARLQAAALGLACERFRWQHGRWPQALDEIPTPILAAVPESPFPGRPFRYDVRADGIVISCFVPDDRINFPGPAKYREPGVRGYGAGFRLWNPDRRGLPPLPGTDDPHEDDPP